MKSWMYTVLALLFALVFVFGSMAGMNQILAARENALLSEQGTVLVQSPVQVWLEERQEDTPAEIEGEGLTETEVESQKGLRPTIELWEMQEAVYLWKISSYEVPHAPVEGQISMEEAIQKGNEWLQAMDFSENTPEKIKEQEQAIENEEIAVASGGFDTAGKEAYDGETKDEKDTRHREDTERIENTKRAEDTQNTEEEEFIRQKMQARVAIVPDPMASAGSMESVGSTASAGAGESADMGQQDAKHLGVKSGENGEANTATESMALQSYSLNASLSAGSILKQEEIEEAPYRSFWRIWFSRAGMTVSLRINAVTGEVWEATVIWYGEIADSMPYWLGMRLRQFAELAGVQPVSDDPLMDLDGRNCYAFLRIQETDLYAEIECHGVKVSDYSDSTDGLMMETAEEGLMATYTFGIY